MQNPGYLRYFFLERHVLAFATDSQPHGDQPWWYYFPVLLGGGLPWIGYLPIVVREGLARSPLQHSCLPWKRRQQGRQECLPTGHRAPDAMPLLWSWLIGWTLLMMLAGSKLATYLWPVFPPHGRVGGDGLGGPDRRHA